MYKLGNILGNIISGYLTFCFGILIVVVFILFIEWLGK